ncbi:hypothetical protein O5169_05050 [Escherichia coli]|nr:hypothetical protein [Escherichia coli]
MERTIQMVNYRLISLALTISAGVSGSPPKNFVRNADSAVNAGSGFTAFGSGNLTMNGVTSYFGVRPRNIAFNYIVRAA